MKFNLLLILGIIGSSLFNFTSNDSPESWMIMPPDPIFRIIENYKSHCQAVEDGAISWSQYSHGVDIGAANEFLMFVLVVILIGRELFKRPVGKYFTFGFFAVFALSFLLMLTIGRWTLGVFGTWLFMISVCGLLIWQRLESKKALSTGHDFPESESGPDRKNKTFSK